MPSTDPVMAVVDRLPLARADAPGTTITDEQDVGDGPPLPFGLRFAVDPITPSDSHKKTYYTVTVKEATQVSKDGTVITIQDDVQKERED